ncbi:MAG: single-stranded DNA-binding protein [Hydrogenoanaerobacterium sp.]
MKAFGLCVLIREVELQLVSTAQGEQVVLNNRIVSNVSKEKKHYIDVIAWGKTAQLIADNFKKGDEIFLEGTLSNKVINAQQFGGLSDSVLTVENVGFTHGRRSQIAGGAL